MSNKNQDNICTCEICGRQVKSTYLRQHELRNHPNLPKKIKTENIKCCVCDSKFSLRQQFRDHVSHTHGEIEKKYLKFGSWEGFSKWLKNEENSIKIHFVKERSPRTLKNGNVRVSYYCQYDNARNFEIIPHEIRKRALKYQGSYKLSGCCPAEIVIEKKKRSGHVYVTYFHTHLGHNSTMAHFRLGLEERKELADKIKAGVTFNKILDDIRDNISPDNLKREDFITRKTLHNITASFKLQAWKKDADDATSISLWVDGMKKCNDDAACLFKVQGEEHEVLDQNDFVLVLITECQAKMLLDFGNRIICLDSIRGTDQFSYQLTSILVIDDHEEGFPAAYMISSRNDSIAMKLFFEAVFNKIGKRLTPGIFMSDDNPAYYDSWMDVMKPDVPPRILICTWHMDRSWREALNKIECNKIEVKEKQVAIYRTLRSLLEETDEAVFEKSLEDALNELMADDSTRKFATFFINTYANRLDTWARCYCISDGINVDTRLENFHRVIKSAYHSGIKMQRLDACIDTLLKVVRDKSHERVMKLTRIKAPHIVQQMNAAHRHSYEINDYDVIEKDPFYYEVKSQSDSNTSYFVKRNHESCPYECDVICNACNTCIHMYNCTCMDFLVKTRMCKHVHKVCTLLRSKSDVLTLPDVSCEMRAAVNRKLEIVEVIYTAQENEENEENETSDDATIFQELKSNTRVLMKILEDNPPSIYGVKKLNNQIKKVIFHHQQNSQKKTRNVDQLVVKKFENDKDCSSLKNLEMPLKLLESDCSPPKKRRLNIGEVSTSKEKSNQPRKNLICQRKQSSEETADSSEIFHLNTTFYYV